MTPSDTPRPSRRDLLTWGGGALATASLSGCSFLSTDPSDKKAAAGGAAQEAKKGKEAPMLAQLVKDGKLPKVEQRLPKTPLVVQPTEKVGIYGGTFRAVLVNAADTSWLGRTMGYEALMRFDPTGRKVIPNIAVSVTPNAAGDEYTIKLREGMKWSDGKPFTADDLEFGFNDWLLNSELSPVVPDWISSAGKPAKLTKVDDVTVKVTFPQPNGLFLSKLAYNTFFAPKHYLQQFHKKYNPDAQKLAKQQKMTAWTDLYGAKNDHWGNPELPTLCAWVTKNPLGTGSRVTFERNPYYFKTDPDGSQLPYLDRANFDVTSDVQVILLKASAGELDMTTRHINTLPNKPVLARGREKGQYHFITLENTVMNDIVISLNLNHKDPVLRKIFQDKNFRVGLSHAMNRPEMIQSVFQRQGVPWQAAPDERSEFYDEEFAKQFTEYDVAKANSYLDKAGLTKKDPAGFRLRPDGKRLSFQVEVASPSLTPSWVDGTQLVVQYWQKVGVDAKMKNEDRTLFYERKDPTANEHDAGVWMGDGGLLIEKLEPRWYFPFSSESIYAELWQQWFNTYGKEGEEPPPETRRQMELYRKLIDTIDQQEQKALYKQILQIAKEQFYCIGCVRIPNSYGIVKNNFHNVPAKMPEASIMATPALSNPEQWYKS
ncbi:ABC transporter substrate-binding protein [Actinopolymorpha sp. NPDC004070]|uniref:ABC transporter substrate-binding protein n=1 Tax=Actinopolymorpha sp. NPDC004070 TaxID=3154548 RepID=UPI0033B488D9